MKRVQGYGQWSLFCPNEAPGLADCWGKEFEELYTRYEREVPKSIYFKMIVALGFNWKLDNLFLYLCCQGKAKKVVPAQNLWFEILKSQIETGTPYMLFKVFFWEKYDFHRSHLNILIYPYELYLFLQDSCNRKSNQQNLGTIKSSNLCTEIIEFTSPTETAVCNLASIALPRFVREKVSPIYFMHPLYFKDIFIYLTKCRACLFLGGPYRVTSI